MGLNYLGCGSLCLFLSFMKEFIYILFIMVVLQTSSRLNPDLPACPNSAGQHIVDLPSTARPNYLKVS